jgi:hypothetical protein
MATLFGMFPFLKTLFADSGYQGPRFAKELQKFFRISPLKSSSAPDQVSGFVVLPNAGSSSAPLRASTAARRLAKDWKCLNRKALAFSRRASIRLMLRKLCNPA